jgi:hypothetical protein
MRSVAGLLARDNVYRSILHAIHILLIFCKIFYTGNLKMKKTIIAMAIAGVVSAPAYAGVSGFGNMGLKSTDAADTEVVGIFGLNANGSVETNGGSTVYGNLSLTSSNAEMSGQSGANFFVTGTVVGIKGGFGDIFLGNGGSGVHMAQLAGDRHDVSQGNRTRNAVGYQNSFGDVSFRVTSDMSKSNGTTAGVTSAGVQFKVAGITVGAGMEDADTTVGASMGFGAMSVAVHSTTWDVVSDSSVAVKLGYSAGDVSASFQTEDLAGNVKSQLDASYALGGGATVKLRSRMDDAGAAGEYTRVMLGLSF